MHMLVSVNNGAGSMAQFNCPELGGSGQWMRGGMIMVGDMFNNGLKATVDNLCNELSNLLASTQVFAVIPAGQPGSAQWWPTDLGSPSSSGAQNSTRYAVFPNRLAVEVNGQVTVYDTLDHMIGGVSQQQGGDSSLTFSSQYGTVSVSRLPVLNSNTGTNNTATNTNFAAQTGAPEPLSTQRSADQWSGDNNTAIQSPDNLESDESSAATLLLIEKVAQLHEAGVLDEDEFKTKKKELLARL